MTGTLSIVIFFFSSRVIVWVVMGRDTYTYTDTQIRTADVTLNQKSMDNRETCRRET